MLKTLSLSLLLLCGCGFYATCPEEDPAAGPIVVLTFDDGPLAANIDDPATAANRQQLTAPLQTILDTLERRNSEAVFYAAGPRVTQPSPELKQTYAESLLAIDDAGQVLGYHGLRQDLVLWIQPFSSQSQKVGQMLGDLWTFERFLDDVLAPTGRQRTDLFQPLFRQPFGGGVISTVEGWIAATWNGWVYHGFHLDSGDWIDNAIPPSLLGPSAPDFTEAQQVNHVVERLSRTASAYDPNRGYVDILFHVNELTAANLDLWLDTIEQSMATVYESPVRFVVPVCYLSQSDTFVDINLGAVVRE